MQTGQRVSIDLGVGTLSSYERKVEFAFHGAHQCKRVTQFRLHRMGSAGTTSRAVATACTMASAPAEGQELAVVRQVAAGSDQQGQEEEDAAERQHGQASMVGATGAPQAASSERAPEGSLGQAGGFENYHLSVGALAPRA